MFGRSRVVKISAQSRWLRRGAIIGAPLLLVALVGGIVAWVRQDGRPESRSSTPPAAVTSKRLPKPSPPAQGYVGSAACAECHPEIAESYQSHPMAHSLAPVLEASVIEDYEDGAEFAPSARQRYRVERTDEGVFHHLIGLDAEDDVLYHQRVKVHYAMGSGKRGRTYLVDRGGALFESPISWYSIEGRWDLSPGYTPDDHTGFSRRITDRCLSCHAGDVAEDPSANDRVLTPPFRETAIGCERCHGPGREHLARHRSVETPPGPDPIVNPAKLAPARRDSVCNQCHLQGAHQVRRYGRSDFDFRPGMNLTDVWSIFVKGTGVRSDRTTQAVSHVEQMHASVCFQASGGELGCISCHDPHRSPPEDRNAVYYRSRCLQCHQKQGCAIPVAERRAESPKDSCIRCHMPPLPSHDVPHVAQTDHRILRRPDQAHSGAESSSGGPDRLRIFGSDENSLPPQVKARAWGVQLARDAQWAQSRLVAQKAEELLWPLVQAAPDDVQVLDAMAMVCLLQNRPDQAVAHWNRVLEIDPNQEPVLLSLAVLYHQRGELQKARPYLRRLLEVNPWRVDLHGRYSRLLASLGRYEQAIASARRAMTLNPSVPQTYQWLAELHQKAGNSERSRHFRELFRKMTKP